MDKLIVQKRRESHQRNTIKRALSIQKMVAEHYEPGNQSKSKSQAYRQYVNKVYPMCERTFWKYMGMSVAEPEKEETGSGRFTQLTLPF